MDRFRHSSTAARYVILSRRAATFLEQGAILVYRDKSITTFCLNLLLKNKCLDHLNLEYAEISHTILDDEICSVVAVAEINQLYLKYCEFEDEEAFSSWLTTSGWNQALRFFFWTGNNSTHPKGSETS
jgi:hypothetical protein